MSDLVDFLLQRIAEDEAVARAIMAEDYSEGHWQWDMHRTQPYRSALVNDRGAVVLPPKNDDVFPSHHVAQHIARHDPARVLAECAAKRKVVEDFEHYAELVDVERTEFAIGRRHGAALAAIYADHPDFREEWRA